MPRYFFNVFHAKTQIDHEGEELEDKHAAWKEAMQTAGQMLRDGDGRLKPGQKWRLEVTDEFAQILFAINVSTERGI